MTEVLIFHHAAGQAPGFVAFADSLRAAGHVVHKPDVYDGHVFADLETGLTHAKEVGFGFLHERALAAAAPLPETVVYAGFSIGAARGLVAVAPGPSSSSTTVTGTSLPTAASPATTPTPPPCWVNG